MLPRVWRRSHEKAAATPNVWRARATWLPCVQAGFLNRVVYNGSKESTALNRAPLLLLAIMTCAGLCCGCGSVPAIPSLDVSPSPRPAHPAAAAPLAFHNSSLRVAAGYEHTCAVRSSGEVRCWGRNDSGQLGDGTTHRRDESVTVLGISDAMGVAAGVVHTCALRRTGEVACWGRNESGKLGNGTTESSASPVSVGGISDAIQIAAGTGHTCALRQSGRVVCWGFNRGRFGDGTSAPSALPVPVPDIFDAVQITAGIGHTCALRRTGKVLCWGQIEHPSLVYANRVDPIAPTVVPGISGIVHISAGHAHTCAVRKTGQAFCWGFVDKGPDRPIPNAVPAGASLPAPVPGIDDAIAVAAGESQTCVARRSGATDCFTVCADGLPCKHAKPDDGLRTIEGVTGASMITLGKHACAMNDAGAIFCWGNNEWGQLGVPVADRRLVPTDIPGIESAVEISAGLRQSCARLRSSAVVCWGFDVNAPDVSKFAGVKQLSVGRDFAAAITPAGIAWWGMGDFLSSRGMQTIAKSKGAKKVSIAFGRLCAVMQDTHVDCWGPEPHAHVENPFALEEHDPWRPGISDAIAVTIRDTHGCALKKQGTVACWGYNDVGQLGNDTRTEKTSAVIVDGVKDAIDIALTEWSSCIVRRIGTVTCWGEGGDGKTNTRRNPIDVVGIDDAAAITAGGGHVCVRRRSGRVSCWGSNAAGQLGDGTTLDRKEPVFVQGLNDAMHLSAGSHHTCAVRTTGRVVCWGSTMRGQLGVMPMVSSHRAVKVAGQP